MDFVQLIHSSENKELYRKLEKVRSKIINLKWSVIFNDTCLNENLWPKYTKIRNHDPALSNTDLNLNYRRSIMKREITKSQDQILKSELELQQIEASPNQLENENNLNT